MLSESNTKTGSNKIAESENLEAKNELTSQKVLEKPSKECKVGGMVCTLFSDVHFVKIRHKYDDLISFAPTARDFDFRSLKPGGGKGGDPLGFTRDKKYIIKELNSGDHQCLLKIAKDLCLHISNAEESSLLVPILCHFETIVNHKSKQYLVMKNCLYLSSGDFHKVYDLKGCADDKLIRENGNKIEEVHKRFYNLNLWCNLICNKERRKNRATYFKGKLEALHHPYLPMTTQQKAVFMKSIRYDVAFLQHHKLMDYSLLVGVSETKTTVSSTDIKYLKAGVGITSIDGSHGRVSMFSIIDYLQVWGATKEIAKCIKTLEHNKATVPPGIYGERFINHFDAFIVPVDNQHMTKAQKKIKQLNDRMGHRCFPFVKK